MAEYRVTRTLMPGLVEIERTHRRETRRSMWDRVKVRKATTCAVTGQPIRAGERAYRPLSNSDYRYERIAAAVIDTASAGRRPNG